MAKKKTAHHAKSHAHTHHPVHHTHPLHRKVDHTLAYVVIGVVVILFVMWVL